VGPAKDSVKRFLEYLCCGIQHIHKPWVGTTGNNHESFFKINHKSDFVSKIIDLSGNCFLALAPLYYKTFCDDFFTMGPAEISKDIHIRKYFLYTSGLVNSQGFAADPMAFQEGLIDIEAEREKLARQLREAEAEVNRLSQKLANDQFRSKAPASVIAKEEEKLAAARSRLDGLAARLAELG